MAVAVALSLTLSVVNRRAPPTIPALHKWTVQGLQLAHSNAEVQYSRRLPKAELHTLYASSKADAPSLRSARPKATDKPGLTHGSPYSPPGQATFAGPSSPHQSTSSVPCLPN
ncbi:hypothetical protein E1301_Tti023442 [Triplophysa tibetana]|uniref:Uncharacterized protein n=1 Tax=Triplophysa tibetana TaxID=1572043 RepID=A0A5A9NXN7_9TELE|nr:hypothetical protein E1301_Tti023442 [Triplophysa tibetana]